MDDVREDIGYRRPTMAELNNERDQVKHYKLQEKPAKMKIEYNIGVMAGHSVWVRRDIAEDMIKHGKAREVRG
jgi:hypothetical protein